MTHHTTWEDDAIPAIEKHDAAPAQGTQVEDHLEGGWQLLRVSGRSQPGQLAGAIAGVIRSGETAHLQAIGAGAVNQAVKAIATARIYLAPEGVDIMCVPAFAQVDLEGAQRTAISLRVEAFNIREALGET